MKKNVGVAVLGLGWMGQAHSRSMLRIPSLFPERSVDPRLVVCADTEESRRASAVEDFGFERSVENWEDAVSADDVDAVWVTAPNMLHIPMIEAATAAGKAVFSEKPIGGKPCDSRWPLPCKPEVLGDNAAVAQDQHAVMGLIDRQALFRHHLALRIKAMHIATVHLIDIAIRMGRNRATPNMAARW